jgi:hypothetical protein
LSVMRLLLNATQLTWLIPDCIMTPQCLVLWRTVTVHEIIRRGEGKFVHVKHTHGRRYRLGKLGGRLGQESSVEEVTRHFDGCTSVLSKPSLRKDRKKPSDLDLQISTDYRSQL